MSLDAGTTLVCGRTVRQRPPKCHDERPRRVRSPAPFTSGDHKMPGQPQASPARSEPARRLRREADHQRGPGEARRRDLTRPLPDPVAIRLSRVPDTAPPYDDEAPGEPESGPARAGALAAAIVAALEAGNRPPRAVQA